MLKPTTPDDIEFILSRYEAVYDLSVAVTEELAAEAGLPTSGVHSVQLVDDKPTLVVKPHMAMHGLTRFDPAEATLVEGHRTKFPVDGFYARQKARYRERDTAEGDEHGRT